MIAVENEIKYRLSGLDEQVALRERLVLLGAEKEPVRREENLRFDTARGKLRQRGEVLRLRVIDDGPRGVLTFKGPATKRRGMKMRIEAEVEVANAATLVHILESLGYEVAVTYGKRREPWWLDGVEVTLDILDVGHFCEMEGPADAIRRVAGKLGLGERVPERSSYAELTSRQG
jgi:predicted adenylyl cyclase CyaB